MQSFKGFRTKDAKAMLVLDLDGTLTRGNTDEIKRVFDLAKKANAVVVFATGRTVKEVMSDRKYLATKGVHLPLPQYLVSNNGQFVYKNIKGKFVEDIKWREELAKKTHFDRASVYDTVKEVAHRPQYLHSKEQIGLLQSTNDFNLRKKEDPDFWTSKVGYYEWNPSAHMLEYFVSHDVKSSKLKSDIRQELKSKGIKAKFIDKQYSKKEMDTWDANYIRQVRPLKENKDGVVKVLFTCPAFKADGIEYLGRKLDISTDEFLGAGNDINDLSVAKLAKKESFFVCVGNSAQELLSQTKKIKTDNIIYAKGHGASGIAEGITQVLQKFRPDLEL